MLSQRLRAMTPCTMSWFGVFACVLVVTIVCSSGGDSLPIPGKLEGPSAAKPQEEMHPSDASSDGGDGFASQDDVEAPNAHPMEAQEIDEFQKLCEDVQAEMLAASLQYIPNRAQSSSPQLGNSDFMREIFQNTAFTMPCFMAQPRNSSSCIPYTRYGQSSSIASQGSVHPNPFSSNGTDEIVSPSMENVHQSNPTDLPLVRDIQFTVDTSGDSTSQSQCTVKETELCFHTPTNDDSGTAASYILECQDTSQTGTSFDFQPQENDNSVHDLNELNIDRCENGFDAPCDNTGDTQDQNNLENCDVLPNESYSQGKGSATNDSDSSDESDGNGENNNHKKESKGDDTENSNTCNEIQSDSDDEEIVHYCRCKLHASEYPELRPCFDIDSPDDQSNNEGDNNDGRHARLENQSKKSNNVMGDQHEEVIEEAGGSNSEMCVSSTSAALKKCLLTFKNVYRIYFNRLAGAIEDQKTSGTACGNCACHSRRRRRISYPKLKLDSDSETGVSKRVHLEEICDITINGEICSTDEDDDDDFDIDIENSSNDECTHVKETSENTIDEESSSTDEDNDDDETDNSSNDGSTHLKKSDNTMDEESSSTDEDNDVDIGISSKDESTLLEKSEKTMDEENSSSDKDNSDDVDNSSNNKRAYVKGTSENTKDEESSCPEENNDGNSSNDECTNLQESSQSTVFEKHKDEDDTFCDQYVMIDSIVTDGDDAKDRSDVNQIQGSEMRRQTHSPNNSGNSDFQQDESSRGRGEEIKSQEHISRGPVQNGNATKNYQYQMHGAEFQSRAGIEANNKDQENKIRSDDSSFCTNNDNGDNMSTQNYNNDCIHRLKTNSRQLNAMYEQLVRQEIVYSRYLLQFESFELIEGENMYESCCCVDGECECNDSEWGIIFIDCLSEKNDQDHFERYSDIGSDIEIIFINEDLSDEFSDISDTDDIDEISVGEFSDYMSEISDNEFVDDISDISSDTFIEDCIENSNNGYCTIVNGDMKVSSDDCSNHNSETDCVKTDGCTWEEESCTDCSVSRISSNNEDPIITITDGDTSSEVNENLFVNDDEVSSDNHNNHISETDTVKTDGSTWEEVSCTDYSLSRISSDNEDHLINITDGDTSNEENGNEDSDKDNDNCENDLDENEVHDDEYCSSIFIVFFISSAFIPKELAIIPFKQF